MRCCEYQKGPDNSRVNRWIGPNPVAFFFEIFELIKTQFWNVLSDEQLIAITKLAIQKVREKEIIETTQLSENPFGVNLITLAPVYKDQLDLVCLMNCRFIVFAGGILRRYDEI